MEGTKLINFGPGSPFFNVAILADILNKVTLYGHNNGYRNVRLREIEDNSWIDDINQRYDVWIIYEKDGHLCEQKFLYLRGKLIDGETFHNNFDEYYERR